MSSCHFAPECVEGFILLKKSAMRKSRVSGVYMRFRTRASSAFASLLVLGWCTASDLPVVYSANEWASREEGKGGFGI